MYKEGDRFIIEIEEVFTGKATGYPQYRIKGFDKLIMDDRGLVKLRKYEDKQKQDAEIKVGDEVILNANAGYENEKVIVLVKDENLYPYSVLRQNGVIQWIKETAIERKTGRHFDEIVEVLAELRGAENDTRTSNRQIH